MFFYGCFHSGLIQINEISIDYNYKMEYAYILIILIYFIYWLYKNGSRLAIKLN